MSYFVFSLSCQNNDDCFNLFSAVKITGYDVDSRAVLTGATYTLNGQAFGSPISGNIPLGNLIDVSLSKPGYVSETRKVIVDNNEGTGTLAIDFYLFPVLVRLII